MTVNISIRAKPGFDWLKVKWGEPDECRTQACSYCGRPFPDEDGRPSPDEDNFMPLILWQTDGHTAEFCTKCQREWFGLWPTPEETTK